MNLTNLTDEELEIEREKTEHVFYGTGEYDHRDMIKHYKHLQSIWHEEQRRYTRR